MLLKQLTDRHLPHGDRYTLDAQLQLCAHVLRMICVFTPQSLDAGSDYCE